MTLVVSHGTALIDGKPVCPRCGLRPRKWLGRRYDAFCKPCRTNYKREYMQNRRAEMVEVFLTREEWAAVKAMRAAAAAAPGRHRR